MDLLKSEISGWIQKRDVCFNRLIRLFQEDTTFTGDSIPALLQRDHNLISRYNLITYYLNRGSFTQAYNVLQGIPGAFNLDQENQAVVNDFGILIPIVEQLTNDTFGLLVPDSTQTMSLLSLSVNNQRLPSVYSRNILITAGLLDYDEPIITNTSLKQGRADKVRRKVKDNETLLKAYPNPCKDYIIIDYKERKIEDRILCVLTNSSGAKLSIIPISTDQNSVVLPLTDVSPGMYLLSLSVNGIRKPGCRIIKVN
jgi:hypothetical protein